ncbi:MAG: hypothetical protein EOP48_09915 [Sphingobacteriales bacterium]|nr:MAG: hypothetical protein EOP48_09915 [Sphingobacteriales bacterium]
MNPDLLLFLSMALIALAVVICSKLIDKYMGKFFFMSVALVGAASIAAFHFTVGYVTDNSNPKIKITALFYLLLCYGTALGIQFLWRYSRTNKSQ